jgi:hypothetical protein
MLEIGGNMTHDNSSEQTLTFRSCRKPTLFYCFMAFKKLRHDFECSATIDSEINQLAMPFLPERFSMMVIRSKIIRLFLLISLMASLTILSDRLQADTGICRRATIALRFIQVQGNTIPLMPDVENQLKSLYI